MNCPKCNADSRVVETRDVSPGTLRRRRACIDLKCNNKFTTLEVITLTKTKHTDTVVLVIPRALAKNVREVLALIDRGMASREVPEESIVIEPTLQTNASEG